ncbi:MAG: pseudouridine synthase [Patescibacteria group bacterium]|jgi:23S rRNA pseudouridine2605 synthase|nr:pseudouridine synthase [Patescibacteria group bacterium]
MRINRYISISTGISRRKADNLLLSNSVTVNGIIPKLGQIVSNKDQIKINNKLIKLPTEYKLLLFNKPKGYIVSRKGQGQKTIYDILDKKFFKLKPIGRLDKDSSGLLLLTNDGILANNLAHPSKTKQKSYLVSTNKLISSTDLDKLNKGILLEDGISKLKINYLNSGFNYKIIIHEGRNRQIRRTLSVLDYKVTNLQRIAFGKFQIGELKPGEYKEIIL